MKVCISIVMLLFATQLALGAEGPAFEAGEQVRVSARSGLNLRTHPSIHGKVLRTIRYGEAVCIENTFAQADSMKARIGWTDGHWLLVSYLGTQGYLFDGFLTRLPIPDHESELCIDCHSLIEPAIRYVDAHFKQLLVENYSGSNELETETLITFSEGIYLLTSSHEGWTHAELVFYEHNINEVMALLRSMLVGKDQQNAFEDGLVFRENALGYVNEISARAPGNEITITAHEDGTVSLVSWIPETSGRS